MPVEQMDNDVRASYVASIQDDGVMPWNYAQSIWVQLLLYVGQHADHERQQLLQRVEARLLARHQMLDAAVIRRRALWRRSAKLHDKSPIGRQSWLG
jgi:hypothetical protein